MRSGRNRQRITWLPTGDFNFVPIHAAGDYVPGGLNCSDFVVSSYTPSLTALLKAQQDSTAIIKRAELKTLLIAEPHAPGFKPLPFAVEELRALSRLIPAESILQVAGVTSVDQGDGVHQVATVNQVLGALPHAAVVHLACHGYQDLENPLKSGFCLRDGKLTIAQIMQQHSPSAFFAFLSACETAKGDINQPDQTVHLAAAMLFTGFRSIVGTMW
jgi:CHAT domain-containing protein